MPSLYSLSSLPCLFPDVNYPSTVAHSYSQRMKALERHKGRLPPLPLSGRLCHIAAEDGGCPHIRPPNAAVKYVRKRPSSFRGKGGRTKE